MRVVTRLTGLNPDTIRAWERRYGAISPERTGGNTRLFSAADVKRLTLLRDVVALGHPVSRVAQLDTPTLERLLTEDPHQGSEPHREQESAPVQGLGRLAEDFITLVDNFDVRRVHDHLARAAALLPTREFLLQVALPILAAIRGNAARWSGGDASQNARLRLAQVSLRTLLAAIPRLHPTERGAPRIMVASPAASEHELAVQIAGLFASVRGFDVVYLGADVAEDALLWTIKQAEPAVVLLGIDALDEAGNAAIDQLVARVSPRTQIWRGPGETNADGPNVRRFSTYEALEVALVDLMHRG